MASPDAISLLSALGLSRGDARVFLSIRKLGEASVGSISAECGVHRANVYDSLRRLSSKSLVNKIRRNNAVVYSPCAHQVLAELISRQKSFLDSALKIGFEKPHGVKKPVTVKIFDGVKHVRTGVLEYVNFLSNVEWLDLGGGEYSNRIFSRVWVEKLHRARIRHGCKLRALFTDALLGHKHVNKLKRMPLTKVRFLPKEYFSPVAIEVLPSCVIFLIYSETPSCVVVESKELSHSFKNYFNLLWQISRA